MPAAMQLAVLALCAAAVCEGSFSSTAANQATDVTSPTGGTTTVTVTAERPPTAAHHISTPEEVSSSPPPSNSPRTPGGTEGTRVSGAPQTDRTSGWTVPTGWTLSSASTPPNANVTPVTPVTPVNSTTSADEVPHDWHHDGLAAHPGAVAIICLFVVTVVLVLVVAAVKCLRSPGSSFERLEEVPMNKVNEESPFARYSK